MEIRVYQAEMPARIKAYTVYKDGWYTIIINSILSREQQLREYRHELEHIANGDFERCESADFTEIRAHS